MTERTTASFYIGDIWKLDSLHDHLPEYMLECGDDVRTHEVENIRWVDGVLVADVLRTEEHGGNECCGGADVLFSHNGKFFIREVSFGH